MASGSSNSSPADTHAGTEHPVRAPSGMRSVPTMHAEERMPNAARSGWGRQPPGWGEVVVAIRLADRDLAEAEAALAAC